MAGSSSSKRSRKRRNTAAAPRAVASTRREDRAERIAAAQKKAVAERKATVGRDDRRKPGVLGTMGSVGERPPSLFGPVPVAELAILIGIVAVVVGFIQHGGPALIVGIIAIGLGVAEFSLREHWHGFRSHTFLLAAVPAVLVEGLLFAHFGNLRNHKWIAIPAIPVFLISFWLLRRRFLAARQRRTVTTARR